MHGSGCVRHHACAAVPMHDSGCASATTHALPGLCAAMGHSNGAQHGANTCGLRMSATGGVSPVLHPARRLVQARRHARGVLARDASDDSGELLQEILSAAGELFWAAPGAGELFWAAPLGNYFGLRQALDNYFGRRRALVKYFGRRRAPENWSGAGPGAAE
eukprot:277668-Chlamydomonas_euryale.AAC.1